MVIQGADDAFMEISGGSVAAGRFFTTAELSGTEVAVLEWKPPASSSAGSIRSARRCGSAPGLSG